MVIRKTTKRTAKKYAKEFVTYLTREKKMSVHQAYLFGSYSKGVPRDWSDIDVAIVSKKFDSKRDPYAYLAYQRRMVDVARGIEPVGFHPKNFVDADPLVAEIKRHGIRIV